MNGKVEYVFEGNLNYTGAVMTWLRKDVGLIEADQEATEMAYKANPKDRTYFVPAFSGLGAPYWDAHATGLFTGHMEGRFREKMARSAFFPTWMDPVSFSSDKAFAALSVAKCSACCEEPHCRSIVTAGTLSGSLEARTRFRPKAKLCSPA